MAAYNIPGSFCINAKERLTGNEVVGVDAGLRVGR